MVKTSADQFALAAIDQPRRYQLRLRQLLYSGPTARNDGEDAEHSKCVRVLADLLRGTDTPMRLLLSEQPGNVNPLGGGRRASTLRTQARAAGKFLAWLSISYNVAYPTERAHATDHLPMRPSQPCTRNALKCLHMGEVFLEEMAGTRGADRITSGPVYKLAFKDFLSTTIMSKPTRHSPRMYTSKLASGRDCLQHQERSILPDFLLVGSRAELEDSSIQRSPRYKSARRYLGISARGSRIRRPLEKIVNSRYVPCTSMPPVTWYMRNGWPLVGLC